MTSKLIIGHYTHLFFIAIYSCKTFFILFISAFFCMYCFIYRFFKERHNVTIQQSLNGTNLTNPELEIFDIKKVIKRINDDQNISNDDAFGPLETDATIILIQVHTRILYLRHLIVSLAQAKGIEKVLLIFSHDYWHPEINELIQKIEFCRVMQIFYPNSIQTHPNIFPGADPKDCPRNIDKKQ